MEAALNRIQCGREVVDRKANFFGRSHKTTGTDISAITFSRQLQELQETEPLQIWAVKSIEFSRKQQAELFVAECQPAHVRGHFVHLVLKLGVIIIRWVVGKSIQLFNAFEKSVTMSAGKLNCLFLRDVLRVVPFFAGSLPVAGLSTAEDMEIEGAATGDATETTGIEFVVVLEFEPVNNAILVAVVVHQGQ